MALTPYLGLCVIFRDNADTLPLLLASVDGHFDDFNFTDTGSKDGSRDLIEAFLKTHPGRLTDFEWCDDFGKARQFNFEQSPARFRCFLDTDDQLVRGERIRPFLRDCELRAPGVEAFFIPYDYDKLEQLPTMRLVRWREGWKWTDAIHERLEFKYADDETGLGDESFGKTDEFRVLHKPKSQEEKQHAIRRNAVIAKREYASTTDKKYRARLARTIAMEMKMDSKAAESIPYQEELYALYHTYPEGRQAAADISKAYQFMAETEKKPEYLTPALEWGKKAGPAYEGLIHFSLGNHEEVIKCAQRSLGRGQQATHEGYVFEKGAIYVAAAASCIALKGPRWADQVDAILNHIPPILRNDASLQSHVTGIRYQADRITILVPGTPQPFDENGGGGMLGGSEEAVVYLSRALARMGRNVRVFTILPPHRVPGVDKYGVDWQQASTFNPENECGTLVLWRAPSVLLNLMQEAGKRGHPWVGVMSGFLWLHDSSLGLPPNLCQAISNGCDGAVVLSDFHSKMIRDTGYQGNMFKLANGIVEEDFAPYINGSLFGFNSDLGRDQNSVVYSSCPSRGLVQLLKMWPTVKAQVPDAKLDIYYDWSMLEAMQPGKYNEVKDLYESVRCFDVKHHGGVDHPTLYKALRKANVWAYAHFESPMVETSCISLMKALAAGATVLTVPNGALPETAGGDAFFETDIEGYQKKLVQLLKNPESVEIRRQKAKRILKRFGWKQVAKAFSSLWSVKSKIRLDESVSAPTSA